MGGLNTKPDLYNTPVAKAIPLAAGVLYPKFALNPALGTVLMTLSNIIVALNAQLLRRSFK